MMMMMMMINFSGEATTLSCPLLLSTGGTSAATSRVDLEHRVQPTRDQELVAKITTDVEKMMALSERHAHAKVGITTSVARS